jgi:hypothetical protein
MFMGAAGVTRSSEKASTRWGAKTERHAKAGRRLWTETTAADDLRLNEGR